MNVAGAKQSLHIVCPLQYELALLRKAGLEAATTLHCCGPGAAAVERAVQSLQLDPASECVLLVGVAGGLSADAAPGRAFLITAVRDSERSVELHPPIDALPGTSRIDCVACSTALPVTTVEAKRALREQCGADLVDLESLAFAEAATARGLRWGIIRGISDGPNDALPPGLAECVTDDGRTHYPAVAWQVLRRPGALTALWHLRRTSAQSMGAAAGMIQALTEAGSTPEQ